MQLEHITVTKKLIASILLVIMNAIADMVMQQLQWEKANKGAEISMNVRSMWHIFMIVRFCMTKNRKILMKWIVVLVTSARLTQHVRIPWEAINAPANQVSMEMEGSVVKSMNVKLQELIVISMQTVLIKLDFMFVNVNLDSGQIQIFSIPFEIHSSF